MMKLTKADQAAIADKIGDIRQLLGEFNTAKQAAIQAMDDVVRAINEKREELHELLDGAAGSAEEYYDEKSEKWQEGDRGSAYSDWKDELRRIADEVESEIEAPELPDLDEPSWVDEVEGAEFVEFNE